jgi:hypothetical protein
VQMVSFIYRVRLTLIPILGGTPSFILDSFCNCRHQWIDFRLIGMVWKTRIYAFIYKCKICTWYMSLAAKDSDVFGIFYYFYLQTSIYEMIIFKNMLILSFSAL